MRTHIIHKFKKFGNPAIRIVDNETELETLFKNLNSKEKIKKAAEKLNLIVIDILCFMHKNRIAFKWVSRVTKRNKTDMPKELIIKLDKIKSRRTEILNHIFLHSKSVERGVPSTELMKEFSLQGDLPKLRRIRHQAVRLDGIYKDILKIFRKPKELDKLIKLTNVSFNIIRLMSLRCFQLLHRSHKILKRTRNKEKIEKEFNSILKDLISQSRMAIQDIK